MSRNPSGLFFSLRRAPATANSDENVQNDGPRLPPASGLAGKWAGNRFWRANGPGRDEWSEITPQPSVFFAPFPPVRCPRLATCTFSVSNRLPGGPGALGLNFSNQSPEGLRVLGPKPPAWRPGHSPAQAPRLAAWAFSGPSRSSGAGPWALAQIVCTGRGVLGPKSFSPAGPTPEGRA